MKKQVISLSAVLLTFFESQGLVAIDRTQWNSEISAGHPVLINTVSSYDSYGTLISRGKMQINTSPVSKSISSIESAILSALFSPTPGNFFKYVIAFSKLLGYIIIIHLKNYHKVP